MLKLLQTHVKKINLTIDERNLTARQREEYHVGTKRKSYNTLPTSNITAEAVTMDAFTLSQTDNAGVTATYGCSYTTRGMNQCISVGDFASTFDADGNQTPVKITIGIRSIAYDDNGTLELFRIGSQE